jgi:hypothetical protein
MLRWVKSVNSHLIFRFPETKMVLSNSFTNMMSNINSQVEGLTTISYQILFTLYYLLIFQFSQTCYNFFSSSWTTWKWVTCEWQDLQNATNQSLEKAHSILNSSRFKLLQLYLVCQLLLLNRNVKKHTPDTFVSVWRTKKMDELLI